MSDAKEILSMILSDEKLLNSKAFRDRVYTDQPILRPASQLRKPETPQRIKDMKSLAFSPEAYWKTSAWLFYTQGKFMEDYSDCAPYNDDISGYYPTYRDFDTAQLRGYFTWRGRVRAGDIREAPQPFAVMYMYELINGIGWSDPLDGLALMKKFGEAVSQTDPSLARFYRQWSLDFAVYYELPTSAVEDHPEVVWDSHLLKLMNWEDSADEELFQAISALSGYQFDKSRYFGEFPERAEKNVLACFRRLSEFFRDHRKKSLCAHWFGNPAEMTCRLFESSVFYDRQPNRSCSYALDEINTYTCVNGVWRCRRYYGSRSRNKSLGEFAKAVDAALREQYGYRFRLRTEDVPKNVLSLIKKTVEEIAQSEQKAQVRKVKIDIDLSQLDSIRRAAAETRDKLIVEEEEELPEAAAPAPAEEIPSDAGSGLPTDPAESAFLRALLSGGDYVSAAKSAGTMVSILADSINEKLFDMFGDTVIDFSGDCPEVIEDYADELRECLGAL